MHDDRRGTAAPNLFPNMGSQIMSSHVSAGIPDEPMSHYDSNQILRPRKNSHFGRLSDARKARSSTKKKK